VRLGPQPSPLLHGDKIEIAGHELLFVDERRSGSTQYVQAVSPAMFAAKGATAEHAPTAGSGGRLVSLTDGREYTVPGTSLVLGRDAACEVVVTSKDVSRRHAEIMATPKGYLLVDSSTNGTFVNGKRVEGQRILARADVIRVGTDEFRFYADRADPPSPPKPPEPPEGAQARLSDTLHGVPGVGPLVRPPPAPPAERVSPRTGEDVAVPPPASAPIGAPPPAKAAPPPRPSAVPVGAMGRLSDGTAPLAFLVVRSGLLKGQRIPIRVPVVNVGRADYNDLVLPDDSVSTVHAKFQRREGIWVLVDLDSTNGSFVDGERVEHDIPLAPGALVRFGEVRAFFEPTEHDEPTMGGSTKLLQSVKLPTDK
jgi:pSer/pThr/pTyr-binding forkhead associated (FHA) protein